MLIEASHSVDGHRLDPRTEATEPFIAWLDEPPTADITISVPILQCRGWAIARTGSPVRVAAQVWDGTGIEHETVANEPRSDVADNLERDFPVRTTECGFNLMIPLPEHDGVIPITVRVDDGTHLGQVELRVRRGAAPTRADYKSTWQPVSTDAISAANAVAGYSDEYELQRTARLTVDALRETTTLRTDDVVLEIGAGVGRVGPAIAPLVRRWIATDVSPKMLLHARERCEGLDNVEFVELNGWDLAPIADESVDLV